MATPAPRARHMPARGPIQVFQDAIPFIGEGEIVVAQDRANTIYIKIDGALVPAS